MKIDLQKPSLLELYVDKGGVLMNNWEQTINEGVLEVLKGGAHFSLFTGEDFVAYVWRELTLNKWAAEVRSKGDMATYVADTIDQLSFEINQAHGNGELEVMG